MLKMKVQVLEHVILLSTLSSIRSHAASQVMGRNLLKLKTLMGKLIGKHTDHLCKILVFVQSTEGSLISKLI